MLTTLGVVPIFVNAGTALLPAILAPLASVLALLLRPRQMLQACRRRPLAVLGGVGGVALAGVVVNWIFSSATPPRRSPDRIDWTAVALDVLNKQELGMIPVAPVLPPGAGQGKREGAAVFRYDFARCGHDGSPAPLGLKPLWSYNIDGAMFLSSPLVVGGRVYGASCIMDPIAGNFGTFFCLDAVSGKPLWTTPEEENLKPFFSSPALSADGKYLVVGQGLHDDKDSSLLCFEAETGKLHWRVQTPLHIEGSPAILGDMVVAGAGAIEGPDHKPLGDPGFVVAVRISDGKELWRYAVKDPESSPAIGTDGTVYIGSGFNGNAVVALRSASDEELKQKNLPRQIWQTPAPYPVTGAVTLIDDLVIVGGGNGDYVYANPNPAGVVMALDAKTGQVRWQSRTSDAVLGAVAGREGKLICPVRNGEVIALRLADGQPLWGEPARISGKAPVLAAPVLAGRYVYAVSKDGYLGIINLEDGKVIERHYINDENKPAAMGLTLSSPMVAGSRVFVGSETGGLRCLAGGKVAQ